MDWISMLPFRTKKRKTVPLRQPTYVGRHPAGTFLVLGNGRSLTTHRAALYEFITKHRPIVMGCNNITGFTYPDYHAFTNRKRFIQYAHSIDPNRSKVLIGAYLSKSLIRRHYIGPYELIMYVDDHNRKFDVQDGIIMASCRTAAVLLTGVAAVMGAARVFVAGLDGYSMADQQASFFYDEADPGTAVHRLDAERYCRRFLIQIHRYMAAHGIDGPWIITPTVYRELYRQIEDIL